LNYSDVSELLAACIIALMMETVRISETSLYFNDRTRHYIPEDFHLQARRRENLKSHLHIFVLSPIIYISD
jgi:hypothetical protein